MIVIAEKDDDNLVVPVTTWRENVPLFLQDDSCILNVNDHSFIKHKSWINFSFAKVFTSVEILNGLFKGYLIKKDDLSKELVDFIKSKAKTSKKLANEFKYFFE